jgi:hypothetical protein
MQQQSNTVKRSQTYQSIYPDDLMLKAFGTTTPSNTQKNAYFFQQWSSWKYHSVTLPILVNRAYVTAVCRKIGLKEFWDYQLRGPTLRFADADMLAFFKMAAADVKWS